MLGLNTNLAEAAALGHDIGHVPCGHQGEAWMAKAMNRPEFRHEIMGAVKAQKVARKGRGLNLTLDTLRAMVSHGGKTFGWEMSPEAWVVYWADKIAYTFGDISDAKLRICWNLGDEIMDTVKLFGNNHRDWASTAISALVIESSECRRVSFEQSFFGQEFKRLRKLMHDVYIRVTEQNVDEILGPILRFLQRIDAGDPFLLLALMTDEDVLNLRDTPMRDAIAFNRTSVSEIAPTLRGVGPIDLCNPCLDW
jgi:dGTP triphosphohydrolase